MVGKTFRVVLTKPAIAKLKRIHSNYREKESVALADKIKSGLLNESKTLKNLPSSKPILRTKKKVVPPHRYTKKWSFKIIFQVFQDCLWPSGYLERSRSQKNLILRNTSHHKKR